MSAGSVQLIYVDPPFNTGKVQSRTRIRVERDADGDRTGFQGTRYRTEVVGRSGYDDRHDDYIGFLEPRIREARRVLEPTGSFFLHIDYREAHYCKILLDEIFGRASFMNEIIWAVHSRPGDTVLDFFAGSGTTGEAAAHHGRNFILVDSNPEAARVMVEWYVHGREEARQEGRNGAGESPARSGPPLKEGGRLDPAASGVPAAGSTKD